MAVRASGHRHQPCQSLISSLRILLGLRLSLDAGRNWQSCKGSQPSRICGFLSCRQPLRCGYGQPDFCLCLVTKRFWGGRCGCAQIRSKIRSASPQHLISKIYGAVVMWLQGRAGWVVRKKFICRVRNQININNAMLKKSK